MKKNTDNLKQQHGFSLLELLVAFSITTMVLVTVYQVHIKGNQLALIGRDNALASVIAKSKLAEFDVVTSPLSDGGKVNKFQWQLKSQPYQPEQDTVLPLLLVDVSVHWQSAGKTRQIELSALKPGLLP